MSDLKRQLATVVYMQINTMRRPTPTECCFCRAGAVANLRLSNLVSQPLGIVFTHDAAAREADLSG